MLLKQRFRIICQVGHGGMGAVYKAEDTQLGNRLVAVKEMIQQGLSTQEIIEAVDAFKREAHILAGLHHPNIPSIHDYFSEAGHWYLIMDFIEAETLEEHLCKTKEGSLPVEEVLDISIQLCTVLDYLHTRQPQIIFRDLKPSNVMRVSDGHLYLIDFGIARHFKPGKTKDTAAFGTLGYAAPELFSKQSTPQSDIYSLGAMLHQLLTGNDPSNTPFRFMPLRLHTQPVLDGLEMLIMQMLDMDENKRPESMLAVKKDLQLIDSQLVSGIRVPSTQRPPMVPGQFFPPSSVVPKHFPVKRHVIPRQLVLAKRGLSRRSILVGLVGLAMLGTGITWSMRSRSTSNGQSSSVTPYITYHGHTDEVWSVAWSPDGTRIASGSLDKTAQVWNATTGGNSLTYRGHTNGVWTIAWSPDSHQIASGGDGDETVQVWDAITGLRFFIYHSQIDSNIPNPVDTVMCSPNGKFIASGADEDSPHPSVQVWDATTGKIIYIYHGHYYGVKTVAWSNDGKRIASGDQSGTVQVWDAITGDTICTYQGQSNNQVSSVTWSPNGNRIASGSYDSTVHVWDASTGEKAFIYSGHTAQVLSTAWSPNGKYIVSGSSDWTAQVWNAANGHSTYTYSGHSQNVQAVAWSPDSTRIASGSTDKTVQVWKAPD